MKYLKKLLSIIMIMVLVAGSVNLTSKPAEAVTLDSTSKQVWDYLRSKGFSEYATAGIMGNIWAESGMRSNNLQNTYEWSLGFTDESYTKAVDNHIKGLKPTSGTKVYKNFVHDSAGYGLCQWTYWSRKQGLYNMAKEKKRSIGDVKLQLDYLYLELTTGYKNTVNRLKAAKSVKEASTIFLEEFERPYDQSVYVQNLRATYGEAYYKKYAKVVVVTTDVKLRRAYGSDRYHTAFAVSDAYMADTKQAKLSNVIIARGNDFPDALAASYLAKAKKAPVLLWKDGKDDLVKEYIRNNLKSGGTIYLLGGDAVVSDSMKTGMSNYSFKRLAGSNRYITNTKILDEAGITKEELLVCDGTKDGAGIYSLIASGTGKPVLLVKKGELTKHQKSWLEANKGKISKIVILGNASSVDATVETQLKKYGSVSRISATNADELSAKVAKKYYANATEVFVATSSTYVDGLCGGILAIANKGPIMLVTDYLYSQTISYTSTLSKLKRVTAMGGDAVVSEGTVRAIAKNSRNSWTNILR